MLERKVKEVVFLENRRLSHNIRGLNISRQKSGILLCQYYQKNEVKNKNILLFNLS